MGACRHPRPAPAPARRAQVRQGRRLVGARGHPIADRYQRTSKHPRVGQLRNSGNSLGNIRKHPHKRGAAPESGAAAAARLPGSIRPTEADAALPPGSSRLGRRAASALPRRMLPGSRAAAARPNGSSRCRKAAAAAVAAFKSLFDVTHISWLPLQTRCRTQRGGAARVCHERGAGLSPCACSVSVCGTNGGAAR